MLNDENFINIAIEIAKGSKCVSKQVGAIIVKDARILSTGYNGTPSGYINCNDFWNFKDSKDHHAWSNLYEIHAEMNALLWAARQGVSIKGATLFCSHQPCFECTKNIIGAGIEKIVYKHKYKHVDPNGDKFIKDNGVELIQLKNN